MYSTKKTGSIRFEGLKIDGRRVKRKRNLDTGLVSDVDGFLSAPAKGSPEEVARRFVDANYRLLAKRRSVVREMEVERTSQSLAGYHVTLHQTRQGVPIEDAIVSVHMTPDKRVYAVRSHLQPRAAELDVQSMAEGGISAQDAIAIAVDSLNAADDLLASPRAELVIVATGEPRLVWKVLVSTDSKAQDWVVMVDAEKGVILKRHEISI